MKLTPLLLVGLLTLSLSACHKQATPAQAVMDAEARQKAVEVREAADKAILAQKAAAAKDAAKAPVPSK